MRRRYIYSLLFGIPGLLLAFVITLMTFGMALGVFWLFVFGDNPWPAAINTLLPLALIIFFLVLWGAAILGGYLLGRRREADPALNLMHVLASAAITVVLLAFVLLMLLRS